jgi:RNA polymerase-binding transcription factor DksA
MPADRPPVAGRFRAGAEAAATNTRGSDPMSSDAEREEIRNRLLALRGELLGDSSFMAREALEGDSKAGTGNLSSTPQHMADRGSDFFDQEYTLGRLENATAEIAQIDEALARLDAGAYGVCEECEAEIAPRRLRIKPWAGLCKECQQRLEEEAG